MFQRLKGAIDRTIAEEQARQEQARQRIEPGGATQRRSESTSRSNQSPARRPRPKKPADAAKDDTAASPSNTDPAVFEAAFALDDSEEPSRAGTPKPAADAMDKDDEKAKDKAGEGQNGDTEKDNEKDKETEGSAAGAATATLPAAAAAPEISPEIRMKLRKLEKLEKTYPGAYSPFYRCGREMARC
ncbi:hypothetical protein LY78DRAFT_388307 [Colletotrichum sublineola]|nr:hypothetical protein LY78DRAFT_388307 [Colletotrichum sublineola]